MRPILVRAFEWLVGILGAMVTLAPCGVAAFAPWPTWVRGLVLAGLAVTAGAIWRSVDWPSGWGVYRDFFAWGMLLSAALGAGFLLWAAVAAIVG